MAILHVGVDEYSRAIHAENFGFRERVVGERGDGFRRCCLTNAVASNKLTFRTVTSFEFDAPYMPPTSVEIPDDATYEEALEIIEEKLYTGARITGEWHGLRKVAEIRDRGRDLVTESQSTNGDVIEDLRERNPGVPPWAFEPKTSDRKRWTGIQPRFAKDTEFDPEDWDDRGQLVDRPR